MAEGLGSRPSPAWTMMGLEVVSAGAGEAVVEMAVRDEFRNRQGVCHGGFIGMLADSAMGRSMHTVLPEGERHFSFDLKLTFISPAKVGDTLRARATVLHAGRRTAVGECRIESGDGRLVAMATASFIVLLPREEGSPDANR